MSRIRSRAFRSSSHGELTVLNQLGPIETPVLKRPALLINVKPPVEDKPRREVVFTIESSETDNPSKEIKKIDDGFCSFLQCCPICKKSFKGNADFYMYNYRVLRAFCSPDCRDDQMILDRFKEELAKEAISPEMTNLGRKKRN